jgi:hypothetical protein
MRCGPPRIPSDIDTVIGVRAGIAPPQMCNGLTIPIVAFDQLYSFDRSSLLQALPRPEYLSQDDDDEQWQATANDLLDRVMQMTDNAGATAEHRALNYLCTRYPAIFERVAVAERNNASLTAVDVRPSPVGGHRAIVDVIFSFTDRRTDVVDSWSTRVDVTEIFPFLVKKLSPYYERAGGAA